MKLYIYFDNFYYYLPLIFRNIRFYAIKILKKFQMIFKKYLYKFVQIDRFNIKKRQSSYLIQIKFDLLIKMNFYLIRS